MSIRLAIKKSLDERGYPLRPEEVPNIVHLLWAKDVVELKRLLRSPKRSFPFFILFLQRTCRVSVSGTPYFDHPPLVLEGERLRVDLSSLVEFLSRTLIASILDPDWSLTGSSPTTTVVSYVDVTATTLTFSPLTQTLHSLSLLFKVLQICTKEVEELEEVADRNIELIFDSLFSLMVLLAVCLVTVHFLQICAFESLVRDLPSGGTASPSSGPGSECMHYYDVALLLSRNV